MVIDWQEAVMLNLPNKEVSRKFMFLSGAFNSFGRGESIMQSLGVTRTDA